MHISFFLIKISFPVHFLFKWRQNLSARPRTSSTEVKNEWRYTSIPLHAFMPWTGKALCVVSNSRSLKNCSIIDKAVKWLATYHTARCHDLDHSQ